MLPISLASISFLDVLSAVCGEGLLASTSALELYVNYTTDNYLISMII